MLTQRAATLEDFPALWALRTRAVACLPAISPERVGDVPVRGAYPDGPKRSTRMRWVGTPAPSSAVVAPAGTTKLSSSTASTSP